VSTGSANPQRARDNAVAFSEYEVVSHVALRARTGAIHRANDLDAIRDAVRIVFPARMRLACFTSGETAIPALSTASRIAPERKQVIVVTCGGLSIVRAA